MTTRAELLNHVLVSNVSHTFDTMCDGAKVTSVWVFMDFSRPYFLRKKDEIP